MYCGAHAVDTSPNAGSTDLHDLGLLLGGCDRRMAQIWTSGATFAPDFRGCCYSGPVLRSCFRIHQNHRPSTAIYRTACTAASAFPMCPDSFRRRLPGVGDPGGKKVPDCAARNADARQIWSPLLIHDPALGPERIPDRAYRRLPERTYRMSNVAEAGHIEIVRPQEQRLIMRWMGVCSDPKHHRSAAPSVSATTSIVHRDQLAAMWLNETATHSRRVA